MSFISILTLLKLQLSTIPILNNLLKANTNNPKLSFIISLMHFKNLPTNNFDIYFEHKFVHSFGKKFLLKLLNINFN